MSVQQMKDYIFFLFHYLYFTQAPKTKGASVFCKCERLLGIGLINTYNNIFAQGQMETSEYAK